MLISSYTAQVTVHYRLYQMGKKRAQICFFFVLPKRCCYPLFILYSSMVMHANIIMNDGWGLLSLQICIFKICCLFTALIGAVMSAFIFSWQESSLGFKIWSVRKLFKYIKYKSSEQKQWKAQSCLQVQYFTWDTEWLKQTLGWLAPLTSSK